ncbi:MAG TPA: leucine-rich repeat domain-containing protein [Candidatus Onthoplasma faecigallinarum]|nr:leucine-rich repeat domain-containing protein [Candidatus Onthoplasma faecigallinarum]
MAEYDDNLIIEGSTLMGVKNMHVGKIVIPDFVTAIADSAFENGKSISLTTIVIPNSVRRIGKSAFRKCTPLFLTNINIPDSVSIIESNTFNGCIHLKNVKIPNSVTKICEHAFLDCGALSDVIIPNSVTYIGDYAFADCSSLKNIKIPDSVTSIGYAAFDGCSSLESVEISASVTRLGDFAFDDCNALKNMRIHINSENHLLLKYPRRFFNNAIITKTSNGYILDLSTNKFENLGENSRKINNPYLINYYIKFFDDKKKFNNLNKIDFAFSRYLYKKDLKKLENKQKINYNDIDNYNIKSINNLLSALKNSKISKFHTIQDEYNFFKLCENIGVLNIVPTTKKTTTKYNKEKVQQIDYSQKAREFLKDRILEGSLPLGQFHSSFDRMLPLGFKQGFADFFLNKKNFDELMAYEFYHKGFIARCYNEFEKVQAAHTSQRGSQRQLAPTVEFFKNYFLLNKFQGLTDENAKIANAISPYFSSQDDFDAAVKIDRERKKKGTPDNILGDETIQEESVFEKVDSLLKETKENSVYTTSTLVDLAERKFTYEFLRKSDPTNFILGKLCSCCAHLEGVGNGIMRASIIHPNVQNIVIRDKTGKIVAKSTIYVNRKEGYAVCNNVEINNDIVADDVRLIYQKYKKAIEIFAEKYNAKYPDKPLKIITVGMNMNDLYSQITENDTPSPIIYKALDYGKYCFGNSTYSGDSSESQYIVWETNKTDGQTL